MVFLETPREFESNIAIYNFKSTKNALFLVFKISYKGNEEENPYSDYKNK